MVVWLLSRVSFVTPCMVAQQAPLSLGFPRQEGAGCHFPLQGIFLTQELNPGLLHCRQVHYQRSHLGSPEYFRSNLSSKVRTLCIYKWLPWTFVVVVVVKVNKCYCEGSSLHVKGSFRIKRLESSLEVQCLRLPIHCRWCGFDPLSGN